MGICQVKWQKFFLDLLTGTSEGENELCGPNGFRKSHAEAAFFSLAEYEGVKGITSEYMQINAVTQLSRKVKECNVLRLPCSKRFLMFRCEAVLLRHVPHLGDADLDRVFQFEQLPGLSVSCHGGVVIGKE